jgi:hypothetical protein
MAQQASPAGRARARRLDRALDQDATGRGHNRDRATTQQPPSHTDPGSRTLPGTHGRIADAQPTHRPTPTTPAPAPAARPAVSPGAPPAAPTPTSPAPAPGGDSGGQGAP